MKRLALAALPVLVLLVEGPAKASTTTPADGSNAPAAAGASSPAQPPAPAAALTVTEAAFGTGVEQRALQGRAEAFPAAGGRVYCLTRVTGGPAQPVVHAWFHEGKQVSEVKLAVDHPSTTTWSYKTIGAGQKGSWRVDVLAADGAVLKSASFTVE